MEAEILNNPGEMSYNYDVTKHISERVSWEIGCLRVHENILKYKQSIELYGRLTVKITGECGKTYTVTVEKDK